MKLATFLCSTVLLIMSCDPTYNIDYIIENNSRSSLEITSSMLGDTTYNLISDQTKLVLFNDFGIGASTEDEVNRLDGIPFFSLEIRNEDSLLFQKDVFDIDNWRKNSSDGEVTLKVNAIDF